MPTLRAVLEDAEAVAEHGRTPAVRERTRWVLADTLTVMRAGATRQPAATLAAPADVPGLVASEAVAHERGARAPSRVLGRGFATSDTAAFLNAAGLTDLEMDEGTRPTGHPAAHILPGLLAVAEAIDATVDDVERALVLGYEVAGWLLESYRLRPGVHPHGHLVSIAAAAAVASLAGRDVVGAAEIATTMGMRVTAWSAPLDGASARNLWAAGAAADAVRALRLVETGWTGSSTVLDELFDGVVADRVDAAPPTPDAPRIMRGYLKLYPSCALTHASIEAALGIEPLDEARIEHVTVRTIANNLKIAAQPQDSPLSRRFSIPFAVAAALLTKQPTPSAFDEPLPGALALASRVSVVEDAELSQHWPRQAPAIVEVALRDGRVVSGRCDDPKGARPGSVAAHDLRAKSAMLLGDDGATWDALVAADGTESVRSVLAAM